MKYKKICIILSVVALILSISANAMPHSDGYEILWAIITTLSVFSQIGLIVLIAINRNK